MSLHTADERSVLEGLLDVQRAEVALLLDEVDDTEARTRLVPSATTVLGLVKHAVFVERVWFHSRVAGVPRERLGLPAAPADSFVLTDDDTVASVRADFDEACDISRAVAAAHDLDAIVVDDVERALRLAAGPLTGRLAGVPTYVKDNTDVAGLATRQGSRAMPDVPAAADAPFTTQLRAAGLVPLGKSSLPEFGWSASTEFDEWDPTRNPWDTAFSSGASSGGAAALVASGVVPIAHANDGGGSIRIPAAACGLVGLKPTRGRLAPDVHAAQLPVDVVCNGVLTRTVRDTAHFLAAAEAHRTAPGLPPVGLVEGPSARRLRVGLVLDSLTDPPTDADTRAAVLATAELLTSLGHDVVERRVSIDEWREGTADGTITEVFACGTAAVVTPVGVLKWDGGEAVAGDGEAGKITMDVRSALVDLQYGRAEDRHGWMRRIPG